MSQTIKKLSRSLKKRRIKILLVFLVGTLIILPTFSSIAQAATAADGGIGEIAKETGKKVLGGLTGVAIDIVNIILTGVLYLSGWFLMIAGHILSLTLRPAFYEILKGGIVAIGWGITRDVCNLFFILILLIIAFATILRLETYDIKRMLPRLLVVALLINFSKMICGLIIDVSQVLMNTFLYAMGGGNFSLFVAKISNMITMLGDRGIDFSSESILNANYHLTARLGMGSLMFIIMGAVFLFLAILLFIRVIALQILIILAPIAWLIGVIPTGKKFVDQWWNNFIQYSFFGAIMAFFLYLSWSSWVQIEDWLSKLATEGPAKFTFGHYVSYATIIILLLASAVVARMLGIAGAGFMVGGAKRLAGWGTRKITRAPQTAMRTAGVAAGAAVLSKIGFKGVARRMKAVEKAKREEEARKKYGPAYARMTDEDLEEEVEGAVGIKRAVAAQAALARASFRVWKPEVAERAKATLERYGLKEEVRVLEGQQPAIAKDTDEVIERIGISGVQKLTAEAITPKVMAAMQRQFSASEFEKMFRGWAKRTRDEAEKAMKEEFTTPEGNINIEMRRHFARATGKAAESFPEPEAKDEARKYIRGLKAENLGKLKAKVDWEIAGRYMGVGQVEAAGLVLSEEQKDAMRDIAETENREAFDKMEASATWAKA